MSHVKLYESWLNEASNVRLDTILIEALTKNKTSTDTALKLLSSYGKVFEAQIRKNISVFRDRYVPSTLWNKLNTIEGVNMAMKNFKDLFFISYGGRGYSNSPLNGFTVKINNALKYTDDGDFFSGITIDNALWRSNEAVELQNIIVNGNEELARGLAASIILLDLGVAITNGMYFMSSSITLKNWKDQENVNLGSLLETMIVGKFAESETLLNIGKDSRMFTRLKDVWTTPYNPRIPTEWKGYKTEYNFQEFIPFVKQMSFQGIVDSISGYGQPDTQPPAEFFAPLYVGDYMATDALNSIDKATEFMKSGGASIMQKAISKFS